MINYPQILSEGRIGSMTLKNRIVMPPMGTLLAGPNGEVTDHMIAYYAERAAGGTGLIIIEVVCVEYELGRAVAAQLRLDDDRYIPGFSRLAGAIQKYGSKVMLQLHHAGNQSDSAITGGKQIVAPSAVTSAAVGEEPRELSTAEVKELVERFVSSAVRAKSAGLDGVELHGAHGYLIDNFLSPHTNRRLDEYGGNFENRMRFAVEIIKGIKTRCGSDFPHIVRISADEFTPYGIKLDEGKRIAQALETAGADALDISAGTYESMQVIIEPITYKEGWKTYLAESIKSVVSIPVITVGAIKRPATAEQILVQKKADFVAIGRGLLCDPEWVNKASEGRDSEIIPCIGCLYCIDTIFASRRIQCAVNARAGRELEFPDFPRTGQDRPVAVIGAGPAGMETARVLALRGFKPVVYEQDQQPGGALIPGCQPPDKEPIRWYKDALIENLTIAGITVNTGKSVDPRQLKDMNPYAVIVATGGTPFIPSDIQGLDTGEILSVIDVLRNPDRIRNGSSVVIAGGGMTGCETADLLAKRGIRVTIVEMVNELASGENAVSRVTELERLHALRNVTILTGYRLTSIRNRELELTLSDGSGKKNVYADTVVTSFGLRPALAETKKWKEGFEKVHVIGDALSPKNIAFAVRTAFDTAYCLQ